MTSQPLFFTQALMEREPDVEALRHAHALLKADPASAVAELTRLATSGSTMAMIYLGSFEKSQHNVRDAERWYRGAYNKDSSLALMHLASIYFDGDRFDEYENILREGVSRDDPPSMYYLGLLYLNRPEHKRERVFARGLVEKASNLGQIRAERHLGSMLIKGQYGSRNISRGVFLIIKAVISGFKLAFKDPDSHRLW